MQRPFQRLLGVSLWHGAVLLGASSTLFIKSNIHQAPDPLAKLPSICTSSPKCPLRSRRFRCSLRFRSALHRPSLSIHRRSVSASTPQTWRCQRRCKNPHSAV